MKVLEAVTFDALMRRFGQEHPYDRNDEANSNDEAETHIRNAQSALGGRWHEVLLEGTEVLDVVLPWHLGEDGDVELIPRTGLTVAAAASRLAALGPSYARTNPLCGLKLARQIHAPPRALFLSTGAVPGADYEELTVREGLIHLDGLHRMLAWQRAGQLVPGRWVKAYVAGLSPADVRHGARHDQDGLNVHPGG
ncbi:DUF6309 family protein [Streptomyces sp. NBC_00654]|uniref:DUF6309 family protein n=1 Tax=Streptomyces sp. NBC_00654 TaxID=2975799 RepID=UPI002256978E|nr:DUF6309 family protein [Streptomyces sp. NBC_00654]MCX4967602.1 DUF6309 family protein [Streptomyces sp. NBC_00654]